MAFLLFFISFSVVGYQYQIKTIVIDAGHGGKDPGAVFNKNTKEKDITLKIALQLGQLMKRRLPQVNIVYTRKKDCFLPLFTRVDIAKRHKADLFISIHCNSSHNQEAYGTETYVMGLHKTKDNLSVAKKENAVVLMEKDYAKHYQGFDPKVPESYILFSLCQNSYGKNSLILAKNIEKQFHASKRFSRGVKQAGFLLLWSIPSPSVLIEVGFLSHKKEAKYLKSASGQRALANSILQGVLEYKKSIEQEG